MKTKAVRMYGKRDIRLEEFDLPSINEDEILAHVVSDSICMSSHKAALQGADHKRIPNDVAVNPVMIGHEFCGEIFEVGSKWAGKYKPGDKFAIQPALNYKGSLDAPGYSFRWIGGAATHVVIPNEVMEMDCLLPYTQDSYYFGSLSEPMSCIVGAFRASYHVEQGSYEHRMGIQSGGRMAILAGCGPMGLGSIDLALHGDRTPSLLVVTDLDSSRLNRARNLYSPEHARELGIELKYLKADSPNLEDELMRLTDAEGFDDVFVMAPVAVVIEQADRILAKDGCMNFFAGPNNTDFQARINFYNVHYAFHHIVATSGGNTEDMKMSLEMMSQGRVNPSAMITHIGGLNTVCDTTLNLPDIPGGKKLIYTNLNLPLTAIEDFEREGEKEPLWKNLAEICRKNGGLWSSEAERYVLKHAPGI